MKFLGRTPAFLSFDLPKDWFSTGKKPTPYIVPDYRVTHTPIPLWPVPDVFWVISSPCKR